MNSKSNQNTTDKNSTKRIINDKNSTKNTSSKTVKVENHNPTNKNNKNSAKKINNVKNPTANNATKEMRSEENKTMESINQASSKKTISDKTSEKDLSYSEAKITASNAVKENKNIDNKSSKINTSDQENSTKNTNKKLKAHTTKMFNIVEKQTIFADKKLSLQTGMIARQADASVIVQYENTSVLCTICIAKNMTENQDFLPLSVNFIAKHYAFGRIKSGYIKREAKPSDPEILIARMIDRSIRPLIADGFLYEINITCMLLAHDGQNNADIPALIGASTLLMMTGIPMKCGAFAAMRMAFNKDKIIGNPSNDEKDKNNGELLLTATKDSIIIIEHYSKERTEEDVISSMEQAHQEIKNIIKFIEEFAKEFQKNDSKNYDLKKLPLKIEDDLDLEIEKIINKQLPIIFKNKSKKIIQELLQALKRELQEEYADKYSSDALEKQIALATKKCIRRHVLSNKGIRIDGRTTEEIRSIDCQDNILPLLKGSALFTRGNTQVLSTLTLGDSNNQQSTDNINSITHENIREKFMLHYNFPSYATGEVSYMKIGPSRREIGHGNLAHKALLGVIDQESLKNTIRIVSEVTEADGSTSMAAICSASMALFANKIIDKQVAGIAMGLFTEYRRKSVIVTDINEIEDFAGFMDCKVAGTKDGITAIQMDTKTLKINLETMKEILEKAKPARLKIIDIINKKLLAENKENSEKTLKHKMKIEKSYIKYVIGSGGKNIREICEISQAKVNITQEGDITIEAKEQKLIDHAQKIINHIIERPQINNKYVCNIANINNNNIFVEFLFKRKGLFISKNPENFTEGQEIELILQKINDEGKCFFITAEQLADNNTSSHTKNKEEKESVTISRKIPRFF